MYHKEMNLSRRLFINSMMLIGVGLEGKETFFPVHPAPVKRIGMIGLSVHSADFTEIINGELAKTDYTDFKVTAIYHPPGNPDVEFSDAQLENFKSVMVRHKVNFVSSIEVLLKEVDAVMVLTNDGRPHLDEIIPVLKAGKRVYLDKPIADTFENVLRIYEASRQYKVPVFSASALRYVNNGAETAKGQVVGDVMGAEVYGPAPIQPAHVDLFWDGTHAVELLYTMMGSECEWVSRTHQPDTDVVVGTWKDGRIGTVRGIRKGRAGFGGTVYGSKAIGSVGKFEGYKPLVVAILNFFRSGELPVPERETVEIYAFMEAAQQSKSQNGKQVSVTEILKKYQY